MAGLSKLIQQYGKVVEYCGTYLPSGLWPQDLLPASKDEIKTTLTVALMSDLSEEEKELLKGGLIILDNFVPFDDAFKAAEGYSEATKKLEGKKFSEEKVGKWMKLIAKYYKE